MAVAIEEFASKGYRHASMNTIVRRLGIAKGSLYQYFRNKETLFLYIFEQVTELVKEELERLDPCGGERGDFFVFIRKVFWAGIAFIEKYPAYFEIYLKVLFESDVPHRETLLGKVRLFSAEYFTPLCEQAKRNNALRQDITTSAMVFLLDAVIDRFLQGYAKSYLDGGLAFDSSSKAAIGNTIDALILALSEGFVHKK